MTNRESQVGNMACWYLIHSKPASEAVAQANLVRQGYHVYYPQVLRPVRRRGLWIDRVASLFPRYLFLRLDVGHQAMGPVRSTLGVATIVRFGSDYTVIPDDIVDSLRQRADPATGLHRLCIHTPLEHGSKVRIVAGAFDGLEGVFQRDSGDDRVVVLLAILGRGTTVHVPAAFVLPQTTSQAIATSQQQRRHAYG